MMASAEFTFVTGQKTHKGHVREVNEDGLLTDDGHGVWIVADGMGGHENGKLASQKVVSAAETIGKAVSAPDLLARFEDRILRANSELIDLASREPGAVIGSTVAGVLIFGRQYGCVWLGDSRVYRIRNHDIAQITRDHTEVQELLDQGALTKHEAENWPRKNVITRAVGVFDEPLLDRKQGELRHGDIFIVCSDGLTGHVADQEILHYGISKKPQEASDALVELALKRGGHDNVTVIVIECIERDSMNDASKNET